MEMTPRPIGALLGVALLALSSIDASAQGLTGILVGTVKDTQGGVLPGAAIRVASPAPMSGAEQTISDDKGHWRVSVLPPGQYVVTVELAQFERHSIDGL